MTNHETRDSSRDCMEWMNLDIQCILSRLATRLESLDLFQIQLEGYITMISSQGWP